MVNNARETPKTGKAAAGQKTQKTHWVFQKAKKAKEKEKEKEKLDELRGYAESMGPDVCRRAIDIALDSKKATWPYIRAILRDKQARGVRCLADWDALEEHQGREKQGWSTGNPFLEMLEEEKRGKS